jgi:hypothetical protein
MDNTQVMRRGVSMTLDRRTALTWMSMFTAWPVPKTRVRKIATEDWAYGVETC